MQSLILKCISDCLQVSVDQMNADFEYQSCQQWDSLSHIKLVCQLEDSFEVQFTPNEILKLTSPDKIIDIILTKKGLKNQKFDDNSEKNSANKIYRGLANIYFDKTKISKIDSNLGQLYYQGYNIDELVQSSSFEDVAFLLIFGRYPSKYESESWISDLHSRLYLSEDEIYTIEKFSHLHPIDLLRMFFSCYPLDHITDEMNRSSIIQSGLNLIAKTPMVIAFHHRIRSGLKTIKPLPYKRISENFLYMLSGKSPTEEDIKCLNQDLILHAEHGSNASCFASRIAIGAKANFTSAVLSGISVFNGRSHGGAIEDVLNMFNKISTLSKEEVSSEIDKKLENNHSIPGFGHRVYKREDPRAKYLLKILQSLVKTRGTQAKHDLDLANHIREHMTKYRQKGLEINVDFYAGLSYRLMGIPDDLSMSLFFMARSAGLTAHILEQYENNILIRPLLEYSGHLKSLKNQNFNGDMENEL